MKQQHPFATQLDTTSNFYHQHFTTMGEINTVTKSKDYASQVTL